MLSAARPVMQAGESICILAVDRQPLFLAGLRRLIAESPMEGRVEQTERSDEAIELVDRLPVDVVLCDARAEPLSGPQLAAALAQRRPSLPVVLLGEPEDGILIADAFKDGAAGFLTKDISLAQLIAGLTAVLAGHLVISRTFSVAQLFEPRAQPDSGIEISTRLTKAEREVLTMIGLAWSVEEIAEARGASQKTVRNQVASIYRKLDLRNRTEAVLRAVQLGLVDKAVPPGAAGAHGASSGHKRDNGLVEAPPAL